MKIQTECSHCGANLIRKTVMKMYFCDIHCKAQWQRAQKPVSEADLREMYEAKGMDCTQISKIYGRDPKSVWNWLKDFGIETRKRGTTGNHAHSIGVPRVFTDAVRKSMSDHARAARLKDGRKPYMKNGMHWLKEEGAVSPAWKGGVTPERQAFYSSEEWVKSVKAVWKRDKGVCQRCAKLHNTESGRGTFHIHHIVSFMVRELRATVGNLVLLCDGCHRFVHSKKNANKEFLK
jgi:hypothetical protein